MSGFSLQGILYIFFMVLMLGLFISASLYIGLNVKKIILEEKVVAKTKNAAEITETSLGPTWLVSFVQVAFAAGQEGFGNEYWYRRASPTMAAVVSIPAETDIANGLKKSILPYFNLPGITSSGKKIDIAGISVTISSISADFSADITKGKITSRIASTVKAFSGLENDERTKISKRTTKEHTISINLQKLLNAGKGLVDKLSVLRISSYNGPATSYLDSTKDKIKKDADDLPLSTKAATIEGDLLVPETLSGLYMHYNLRAEFSDDIRTPIYDYLNEVKNKFEKKPFSVVVKAEDYLVALDCGRDNNRHTYSTQNDLACDSGKIYSCSTAVLGIGTNLLACGGRTGASGSYGCGESGFKTSSAVDETSCYCTAFRGNWVGGERWTCPRQVTQESAEPISGWSCTPIIDRDLVVTGYKCTTTVHDPKSCPKMECDLNGRFCTPNRC